MTGRQMLDRLMHRFRVREAIGQRIRKQRELLGMTTEAFSETLGIWPKLQENIEEGLCAADELYLQNAHRLGLDVTFILCGPSNGEARS